MHRHCFIKHCTLKVLSTFNIIMKRNEKACGTLPWIMHLSSHPSVQGAYCLDIGFRHMFSALDCVAFDRELTQSLGTRFLVSVLRAVGAIFNLFYICFTLDNQIKVYIVLIIGCPRKNETHFFQFIISLKVFNRYKSFIYQSLGTTVDHICVKLQLKCFLRF